ncbi:MAG: class I SAM-dependent methyltransferase [Marinobacterium sp.]|nr:class I SAM-dependent methyltransferase [Marinobacterium sp.]
MAAKINDVSAHHHMNYQEIFDRRGQMYHEAMLHWPDARQQEFTLPLSLLNLQPGDYLVDLPSGGGYLQRYLADEINLHCLESSQVFADYCQQHGFSVSLFHEHNLPLADGSVDKLLSIAGIHHIVDKQPLFNEIHRVIRPDGLLCIADVETGSAVAGFLDDVVDRYSETGHRGYFLDHNTLQALAEAGFCQLKQQRLHYQWQFPDEEALLRYCWLLFGLEKARLGDVKAGLQQYLNIESPPEGGARLEWQLLCFTACR